MLENSSHRESPYVFPLRVRRALDAVAAARAKVVLHGAPARQLLLPKHQVLHRQSAFDARQLYAGMRVLRGYMVVVYAVMQMLREHVEEVYAVTNVLRRYEKEVCVP